VNRHRLWERRLFYYVRRLVPQEADAWDVLQQAWLGVLRGIHGLREPRALRVWLYRLARNTAVSHCRAEVAHSAGPELNPGAAGAYCDAGLPRLENGEYVHHALGRLPVPLREVLTLYFLEGMPIEEISAVLGVPPGTVKSRLPYARGTIREALAGEKCYE